MGRRFRNHSVKAIAVGVLVVRQHTRRRGRLERDVLVGEVAVSAHRRHVVHRLDHQGHLSFSSAGQRVLGDVAEAVGSGVVGLRRVDVGAVRRERHRAVVRAADEPGAEGAALAGAVIAEHAGRRLRQRNVLVGCGGVTLGLRSDGGVDHQSRHIGAYLDMHGTDVRRDRDGLGRAAGPVRRDDGSVSQLDGDRCRLHVKQPLARRVPHDDVAPEQQDEDAVTTLYERLTQPGDGRGGRVAERLGREAGASIGGEVQQVAHCVVRRLARAVRTDQAEVLLAPGQRRLVCLVEQLVEVGPDAPPVVLQEQPRHVVRRHELGHRVVLLLRVQRVVVSGLGHHGRLGAGDDGLVRELDVHVPGRHETAGIGVDVADVQVRRQVPEFEMARASSQRRTEHRDAVQIRSAPHLRVELWLVGAQILRPRR